MDALTRRFFAVIPAAGESSRMGRPKLLLPVDGQPLIEKTITAWRQSRVDKVMVVVRQGDTLLAQACKEQGAAVVVPPTAPPDMKASIQAALTHIAQSLHPQPQDAFLVAPADIPRLLPAIINRLIACHDQHGDEILVPEVGKQRGHPVLFSWPLFENVLQLAEHEGLNTLVDRLPTKRLACDDLLQPGDEPFADIDTPADYKRLR